MNARVIVRKPGGLDALETVQEAAPTPQAGQVRVRIQAAGAAYGDVMLRRGVGRPASLYPVTPGYDFAGVVEALGTDTRLFKVGDQVAGLPFTGGYQRLICLPETELLAVPPGLSPGDVASVMLNYTTAYQLLHRAVRLKPGDAALIHGAAGGVGTAMLQLARLMGVKLYGTVSSGKMELVRQLGGVPIDYKTSDFVQALLALEPGGVQAVFDPVGGPQLSRSYQVLARGGTLVAFGASAAVSEKGSPTLALVSTGLRFLALKLRPDGRHAELFQIEAAKKKNPEQFRQDVQTLLRMLQGGQIRPQIAQVLPLSEVRRAHELLEAAQVTGKIILRP